MRAGARLFSSPDLPDHPRLAPLRHRARGRSSIAASCAGPTAGCARSTTRRSIATARLFDRVVDRGAPRRTSRRAIFCARCSSTWPYPLRRVMEREGLGRLCVTQKANLDDRARRLPQRERARRATGSWSATTTRRRCGRSSTTGTARRRRRGARSIWPSGSSRTRRARAAFAASLRASPGRLATAMFAELFASPGALGVDLLRRPASAIARPTTRRARVSDDNWRLRVAPDYAAEYARDVASDDNPRALSLPRALAMALRADPQRARIHEGLLAPRRARTSLKAQGDQRSGTNIKFVSDLDLPAAFTAASRRLR